MDQTRWSMILIEFWDPGEEGCNKTLPSFLLVLLKFRDVKLLKKFYDTFLLEMGVFCHSGLAHCLGLWSHSIYMNMREGKPASVLVGNPKISLDLILVIIMRTWNLSRTTFYCLYLFSLRENGNPVPSSSHGRYIKVVNGFTEHLHFYKCIICTNLFHPSNNPIELVLYCPWFA